MRAVEIVLEIRGGIVEKMHAFHREHPTTNDGSNLPVIYLFDHDNAQLDVDDERDRALDPIKYDSNTFPHRTAEDYIKELLDLYED
jgi:hypothetical protein